MSLAGAAAVWVLVYWVNGRCRTCYDVLKGHADGQPARLHDGGALSLPEMILLCRVLKPPFPAIFIAVVGSSIVAVGYLVNFLLA